MLGRRRLFISVPVRAIASAVLCHSIGRLRRCSVADTIPRIRQCLRTTHRYSSTFATITVASSTSATEVSNMRNHSTAFLAGMALLSLVGSAHANDEPKVRPGMQFDFAATACVTEDAGRAIVAAGKKTGSGYAMFEALKAQGVCGFVETPATLVRVLDTFTDTAIGAVALTELTVTDGADTKTLYGLLTPDEIDLSSI